MTAYVEASVLLRVTLGQRGSLAQWSEIQRFVTSALTQVECLRTLDRLRLGADLTDERLAAYREAVYRIVDRCEVVLVGDSVLELAARPLPTLLGTLDAIHLASAVLWREQEEQDLVVATHDVQLATAERATGLRVLGA